MSIYLYGASGHGKVVKEILDAQHRRVAGFVDDNPNINELVGAKVIHGLADVDEIIVSIGNNAIRKEVAETCACKIGDAAVHPSASVSPTTSIGEGSVVMAGAVINADVKMGKHCIVNTGARIDHECIIGDYVHIAPNVALCGNVHVGDETLIGVGSSIIPGIHIGKGCVIGAGSVVVSDIPDNSKAYGNPCKVVGEP